MCKNYLRLGYVICLSLLLSACVTTTNMTPVNKTVAHSKRIELGMKYLDMDMRDNARRQFSMALELMPKSAQAYHGIALVHLGNGEIEPARAAFDKALSLSDDKNVTAIEVSYGQYLMRYGDKNQACQYFEKATVDYDYVNRVDALYYAGQCAQITGNLVRERSAYEHVVNLNPNYLPVLLDLASIYFKSEEYSKSRKLLDTYEQLSKPSAKSLWLGIRIERIFGNKNKEASYALALKNNHPYSKEYLEYTKLIQKN